MDKQLLETSLGLVAGDDDELTRHFYSVLFTRYPEVRPMFGGDLRPQAAMLREAIIAVLDHLDEPAWLAANLGPLGSKHAGRGLDTRDGRRLDRSVGCGVRAHDRGHARVK